MDEHDRRHVRDVSVRRRRCRDDDGLVLVVLPLVLVTMMVFAAFAVDLGGLYNARRQDQSAADVAALSSVQGLSEDDAQLALETALMAEATLGVEEDTSTPSMSRSTALAAATVLDWDSCGVAVDADSVDTPLA